MNMKHLLSGALILLAAGVELGAQTSGPGRQGAPPPDPTRPTTQPTTQPGAQLPAEVTSLERFEREFGFRRRYWRPVFRMGQDYALRAGERVRSVTVAFGSARIEGRVEGDLAVIFGSVTLASTAVVEGSFVVIGGEATVEPGALVRDEVIAVGAGLNVPENFVFGGQHVVIGTRALGARLQSLVPWITGGLLLGRPVVPSIGWVWSVLALFFIVYLLLNVVAHGPVTETATVLAARPFGSFMTGLLVLLLAGPVSALLAVSIIGIAVIPFALAALVVAGFIGRVGVLRAIGNTVMRPDDSVSRALGLRSFVIGFVLVTIAYMVPVLGFVLWALLGVLGLGAAVLAFLAAWRREYPKQEKPSRAPRDPLPAAPPPPPPAAPASPTQPAGGYAYAAPREPVQPSPAGAVPFTTGAAASAAAFPAASASDLVAFPRAAFLDRAAAFVIDAILVTFIVQALHPLFFYRGDNFTLSMLLIYFVAFWTWKGTTIGGIVVNLRVVKVGGGELSFLEGLVRGLMGVLSFGALGIGVLWILRNDLVAADGLPARQAWHDLAAGTYVVRVPRGYPLP